MNHTLSFYLKQRDQLLSQIRAIGPVMDGSIVTIMRTCGKPGCKCARGQKHPTRFVTHKLPTRDGQPPKTETIYIPLALQPEAETWGRNSRKLKKLIREISDVHRIIIRLHVLERGPAISRRRKKSGKKI